MDKKKAEVLKKLFGTATTEPVDPNSLPDDERKIAFEIMREFYQTAEDIRDLQEYEKIFSTVPDNAIIPVSKLAKKSLQLINGESDGVLVDTKKTVAVTLTVNRDGVQFPENYTRYDDCVQSAVCSLLEAGNNKFTAEMVYRAMNGLTNSEKISPQAVGSVTKSLDKQRNIDILIDFSEQAKAFNKNLKKSTIRAHAIECRVVEGETHNGYKKQVYVLTAPPPIYEYSKIFNQIRTVPIELLNVKGLRNSEQITIIKNYLLTQVESMRGTSGRNKTIKYETLFSDCGLSFAPTNPAKDAKKYRGYIEKILEQWTKQEYIKGYAENKKGQKFVSVTIKL